MTSGARLRRVVPPLLGVGALSILCAYLYTQRAYVLESYQLRPLAALQLALLCFGTVWMRAVLNRAFFKGLGIAASFRDWFALTAIVSFSNYLPLSSGMLAKAFFLKRVHSMPYRRFATGQLALVLLVTATNGGAGLLALTLGAGPEKHAELLAGALLLLCCAALPLALPSSQLARLPARWRPWQEEEIGAARGSWPGVMVAQLGILLAGAASLRIGFAAGGLEVGLGTCIVIAGGAVVSQLVAFVPGSLGVRELAVGGIALLCGFSLRDAVIASALVRAVELVVVLILGAAFTYRFSRRVADSYAKPGQGQVQG